jgi:hypothetical protein
MMPAESGRKFNTVEEIYDTYLPHHKVLSGEALRENEIGLGNRLASNLLEEFRTGMQQGTPGFTQEEDSRT